MSFEVDRYTSAWAHIALCANLTWATEPPDEFILANQRLWTQHRRVSQALQNSRAIQDRQLVLQENGCEKRSVKDVIPESRLAQFYGNFYYDNDREKCYTCSNEQTFGRSYSCENSDLTECWMLPEVEYWFCKLMDNSDRNAVPRRRRQYKILADDDFKRCDSKSGRVAEEALEAKIRSVRSLWNQPIYQCGRTCRPPNPPSRKIRARRRQPKSLAALAPPPPAYCVGAASKLFSDPNHKIQFDIPRSSQANDYQRAMGRLSASVQALMRANAARCPTYRGTNISRYTPTIPRPTRNTNRRYVWWSKDKDPQRNKDEANQPNITNLPEDSDKSEEKNETDAKGEPENKSNVEKEYRKVTKEEQKQKIMDDGQLPSTSADAIESIRKKRLYSAVLSTIPPIQLTVGSTRLSKNDNTSGLVKLNPKYGISSKLRTSHVDNKFEELEKEALEQYKDSDESIDTKFQELEKQAVEQYSTTNSNTSCSSENSEEKKITKSKSDNDVKDRLDKSRTKSVDSVVIYSQNFPDLISKVPVLKNLNVPPRGEKKDCHRSKSIRNTKIESKRAASDTDNEAKDINAKSAKGSKGAMRWTLHVMPPKKRHLSLCVSDFSSEEEIDSSGSIKDAGPTIKSRLTGKIKMSAHGGGDLHPILRKA